MTTKVGTDELVRVYAKYIERWARHREKPQAFIVRLLVDGPFALPASAEIGDDEIPYRDAFAEIADVVRSARAEATLEPVLRSRLAEVLIGLVTAECARRHGEECSADR